MTQSTSVLSVESELRKLADDSTSFRMIPQGDLAGRYAFLFGLATVKLAQANYEIAQANREIERLRQEVSE